MADPKPFASLSPSLLARKGGAKPAMRPQLAMNAAFGAAAAQQIEDDLGWNDHGEDAAVAAQVVSAEVVQLVPEVPVPQIPVVVRQQNEIAARIKARPRQSALAAGRRAAFTLRVDSERHLRLRLACALANRSAQQMVTDALDQLLDQLPDVATLAAQVSKAR